MLKQKAQELKSLGLNPVPLKGKIAQRKGWKSSIDDIDNYEWESVGICTGSVSGGLECLDFDLKYYDEGDLLMKKFQAKVGTDLINKLVVQRTQSGGYHMLYRCEKIGPNAVLASNKKGEPIIETRGEGGYFVAAPSQGYELINKDFSSVPIISQVERNKLFSAAHLLDEEVFVKVNEKRIEGEHFDKFPDYNNDPKVGIDLLESNEWTFCREDGDWQEFTRPGKSFGVSAGYNMEGCFFYVHTSSTVFKERTVYNNIDLFAIFECNGDYRVAYAKLYEEGYGIEEEREDDFESSLLTMSFISTPSEEEESLKQAAEGSVEQGLSTGWEALDQYYLLKRNSLDFSVGYEGVGKSYMMSSLQAASNVQHGWKWGIIAPENKASMNRRRLMEAHSGMSIKYLGMNQKIYNKYLKIANDNYFIVKAKKHYSILEAIKMGKRMFEEYGIDALLIDPWNFFRVEGNAYDYTNRVLSELRIFTDNYCSTFVMAHPNSETTRSNMDKDGFLKPPTQYHIQGGANFAYRVDNFFGTHRIKNHPDEEVRRTMQWIQYKIKEYETGGKEHDKDDYTALEYKMQNNFIGYWDMYGNNPMYKKKQEELNRM